VKNKAIKTENGEWGWYKTTQTLAG